MIGKAVFSVANVSVCFALNKEEEQTLVGIEENIKQSMELGSVPIGPSKNKPL